MGDKNTVTKKHTVGGTLLSTSIFLGGLVVTVISSKTEEVDENLKGE